MSLFEIKCPMCKGTLWVDPASGRIVDHNEAGHQKASLEDFMKNRSQRGSMLEEQFKKAKEENDKRKEMMDQQFKRAKEHPEELKDEDGMKSPFDWD